MNKSVLAGANYYNEKYFIDEQYLDLPTEVKKEIKVLCVTLSEKLKCIFLVGFYENGTLFFETNVEESDNSFDENNAKIEIDKIQKEQKELVKTLQYWYVMFKTEDGKKFKEKLLENYNNTKS